MIHIHARALSRRRIFVAKLREEAAPGRVYPDGTLGGSDDDDDDDGGGSGGGDGLIWPSLG